MDAFCSPGGFEAFGKVLGKKIKSSPNAESQEEKNLYSQVPICSSDRLHMITFYEKRQEQPQQ